MREKPYQAHRIQVRFKKTGSWANMLFLIDKALIIHSIQIVRSSNPPRG
jgi:hypothetical protein